MDFLQGIVLAVKPSPKKTTLVAIARQRYRPRTMSFPRAIASAAALAFFGFTFVSVTPGCSSENIAAAPACDSAKCKPGNKCLPLDGEVKCRKTCSSNSDPATSCPAGYTCVAPDDGNEPFCVQDNVKIEAKPKGQWGFPCNATGGLENPDCDGAQEFYCYGVSPTDGNAYCTRYSCETDRDCGAGFWCATVNVGPNVASAKRTIQDTQKVCLKRTFCSTCKVDLDCPAIDGRAQHCIQDEAGAGFCTPECGNSTNCNNEAKCVDAGIGPKVCYPRAGVCVGDGSLCSPCRSDADCGADGACLKGQYTTEKSCAKKAPQSCNKGEAQGGCVKSLTTPKVSVYCLGGRIEEAPVDYCHGFYEVGGNPTDVGCWTPPR